MNKRKDILSPLDRRRFVKLLAGGAAAAEPPFPHFLRRRSPAAGRKVIVLGLDGLDPTIVKA